MAVRRLAESDVFSLCHLCELRVSMVITVDKGDHGGKEIIKLAQR